MPATLTNWLATAVRPRWLQGIFWPTLLLWLYAPELLPPYGLRRQSDSGDGAFERKRTPLSPRTFRACESGVAALALPPHSKWITSRRTRPSRLACQLVRER